jgi:branched-chain amino acid transport system substrate-binding protein
MDRRSVLRGMAAWGGVWAGGSAAAAPAGDSELVIGQVSPLTGVIAGTGNEYVAGAAAYFAQVNAQGGLHGRRIRVALRDDAYNPEKTLQQTQDLLARDKPIALFGFVGTGNVLALHKHKVLSEAGIALLAPYTGAMDLRDPAIANIFHIRASYTDETARMVEHLHTTGIRRMRCSTRTTPSARAAWRARSRRWHA